MKREIPESVAKAINEIQSFCKGHINCDCDECPFWIPYDARDSDYCFCLFNKYCPTRWNINEEKHYYVEYSERS